ncbi:type III endosome membrane protein TEMP-like [Sinocyclocheilus anshuiensis]|uniref:type III endosome membrane protein TEMP-like n=1 Tax=Sinocyclocheilus anshuiensis TaxID=1608454 RepID=UPI0007B7FCE2|nr:PREDICTED: type III endosome membrane protein TEMP-like [Sinocyclocheilus anshuiensis]
MGNIHHRVNMVLIALVMAMSAHEFLTPQENQSTSSSELPMNSTSDGQNDSPGRAEAHSAWPIVLGALTAVLSIGLLIALAVRYRFFRWCLTRNSPALLLEGETASQFSQAGDLEREIPVHGMRGRMIRRGESSDDDDDDGFIEDNYIQANEREKAEEEEIQQEDTEDSDDELVIPDTIYAN